jgi:ElaA protein
MPSIQHGGGSWQARRVDFLIRDAALADIDPVTLYKLLALRVDVFVVEQDCPYHELDGRELEPGARLVWAHVDDEILATLRVLWNADGAMRIGRVATAPHARSQGVAARLMEYALTLAGDAPVVLHAQTHLQPWYARFGFVRDGDDYVEDGIPHTPMRLA